MGASAFDYVDGACSVVEGNVGRGVEIDDADGELGESAVESGGKIVPCCGLVVEENATFRIEEDEWSGEAVKRRWRICVDARDGDL